VIPSRTLSLLNQPGPPALLVSLPANDLDLARAALDGGADGLKVHINVHHAAAGVQFGSLAQERAALEEIVSLGLPVGIVPGDAAAFIAPEEVRDLAAIGLDYMDVYLGVMPAWLLQQEAVAVMAALGHEDMAHPHRLKALASLPQVAMVEASIVPHEGYGTPLSVADLCDYTEVADAMSAQVADAMSAAGKPVIVPTQRRIGLADLRGLAQTGIRGLLIGAIVTGREPDQLRMVTQRYQDALQGLAQGQG